MDGYQSMPWWRNLCGWQKNCLESMIQLSFVLLLIQDLKCPKVLDSFIIARFWPRVYIKWLMHMDRTLDTNRISQRTFVLFTKKKLVSSSAITSSWKTFVPSCTCHIVNIGECIVASWALHTIVNHHNMEMTIIIFKLDFTNTHFRGLSLKLTSLDINNTHQKCFKCYSQLMLWTFKSSTNTFRNLSM